MITSLTRIYDNKLKINSIIVFFEIKNSVTDNGTAILNEISIIKFDRVGFKYPESFKKILDKLDLVLKQG